MKPNPFPFLNREGGVKLFVPKIEELMNKQIDNGPDVPLASVWLPSPRARLFLSFALFSCNIRLPSKVAISISITRRLTRFTVKTIARASLIITTYQQKE